MASSINKKYQINHGEAVSIGILCEMKYAKTNIKFVERIIRILKEYALPTKVNIKKKSKFIFKKKVFDYLFLDKKRISRYPRYIKIIKKRKTAISEIKDFAKARKIIASHIS